MRKRKRTLRISQANSSSRVFRQSQTVSRPGYSGRDTFRGKVSIVTIRAPGHSKRTHRKAHRKTTSKRGELVTVVESGLVFAARPLSKTDIAILPPFKDLQGRLNGLSFSSVESSAIESSENLTTCEIRSSCPGRTAKSALVRIANYHNGDLIVRHEKPDKKTNKRPTHTIDQILRLPGSTIGELLKDGALTIAMPDNAIPLHRLGGVIDGKKVILYRDSQTRVESKSSGHDAPLGVTPGQDGRGRRPGNLPTTEELDRKENGNSETSKRIMPTGGISEIESNLRNAEDDHQQHVDNLPA